MSTSGSIVESHSSSSASEQEASDISEYELEVEEFESLSDGDRGDGGSETQSTGLPGSIMPAPYNEEPLADEEWASEYNKKKEKEATLLQALQDRLDSQIPIEDWWAETWVA